jgi:hypothetical protein
MKEIIAAIDQWLKSFSSLDTSVGSTIQLYAMGELAFLELLDGELIPMGELRSMANDELQRLGEPRIIKPIPVPVLPRAIANWVSLPYPDFVITPEKNRRGDLEEMEDVEIRELYYERKAIETKRERINYILESEKGDE